MYPIDGLIAFKDITFCICIVPFTIMVEVLIFYKSTGIFIVELNWASIGVCFNRMPITIGKFSFNLIAIIWIKVNLYPIDGLIAFKDFSFFIKVVPVFVDENVAVGTKVYFSTRIFVVEVAIIAKYTFGLFTIIRVKVYRNIVNGLRTFKPFTVISNIIPVFVDLDITIDYESTSDSIIVFIVTSKISLNLGSSFLVKEVFSVVNDCCSFDGLAIASNEVGLVINGNETISN